VVVQPNSPHPQTGCSALSGAPADYPCGSQDLGDGVFAWWQPNGSWGEANAGLVCGRGTSLLVDTLWDDRLAGAMLSAFAAPLHDAPLDTVLTTHRDGDHWWGNVAVPSSASIVATRSAAAEMAGEPPPSAMARLRRLAGLGTSLPGPIGRVGRYSRDMLAPFAFDGLTLRQPDETFEGHRAFDVGGRAVEALEVGPAHTEGDAVVHVPHAGVVFCGDVVFAGVTPVVWSGPVTNWIAALDRCLTLDADRFVPGHGPLAGRTEVGALRDYWIWLLEAGGAEHEAGRSPRQAARRLVATDGFGAFRHWQAPERLAINLVQLFRERDGLPPLPTTAANRLRLFRDVADLAAVLDR
jgi:glyoxylase-like metal-dependent hydrolase (beta-lactamase superfamily II)